jgi:hypothetical protein
MKILSVIQESLEAIAIIRLIRSLLGIFNYFILNDPSFNCNKIFYERR